MKTIDKVLVGIIQLATGGDGKPTDTNIPQRKITRSPFGAHSLRHVFCTQAVRAGATAPQLAAMTGDSAATACKFYVDAELIRAAPLPEFRRLLPGHADTATDPERAQLHRLADALPLERVRALLKSLEA